MGYYMIIMIIIIGTLIILGISSIFETSNNKSDYDNIENENAPYHNKSKKRITIRLIEGQNTIKYLTIFNTILLIVLITIVVFVIIKIYPYLDTLKQYYQLLENIKQWIN